MKVKLLQEKIRKSLYGMYGRAKYDRMVRAAERYHAASPNHSRVAVITHPSHPDRLLYLNKAGLSRLMRDNRNVSRRTRFKDVANGAWYFTAGPEGRGMDPLSKAARRKAFIESVSSPASITLARKMRRFERKEKIKAFKADFCEFFSKIHIKGQKN